MLEGLLKTQKISQEEFELYQLFQANELGRKCLERMTFDTFMDEPNDKDRSGVGFAFFDGRRSVFRDIRRVILFVENKIKETTYDAGSSEQ